jgi:hypothetical protein
MRRLLAFTAIFICFLTLDLNAQPFEDFPSGIMGLGRSYVAWGDYDNDGDLDVAVLGINTAGEHHTIIYRNDAGAFSDIKANLTGVKDGSLEWGDYDNDEDLDLLVTGETFDAGNVSLIYTNNNGVFEEYDAGFTPVGYGQGTWGDYDGDGDLDVFITGSWTAELYENVGGSFTRLDHVFGMLQNSRTAWGDIDNDGDLDLLLTGDTGGGYISYVYRNDGDEFTYLDLGMVGVFSGTADWIDYDNDGDMDISITGFDIYLEPRFLIYTNNGDGTVDSLSHYMEGIATSGVDWGDYDNDGDLDILMTGKTGCCGGNTSKIFRNDPDGFSIELDAVISGAIRSNAAWADYDNDGDLDFLLTGMTPSEVPYTTLYLNAAGTNTFVANTPPVAPEGLDALVNGNSVTLSWARASDDQTPADGLNYNIRIGQNTGLADVVSSMASATSGFRYIQALGNIQADTTKTIVNLPEGTYYWSVQTIDQAYSGSAFAAEQSFTILATGIDEEKDIAFKIYPNPAREIVHLSSGTNDIYEYHIFNMTGQEVLRGKFSGQAEIDVSDFDAGIYFVNVNSGTNRNIQKLVKE